MDQAGAQRAEGGQVGGGDRPPGGQVFQRLEGEAAAVEPAGGVGHQADVHQPQVARQRGGAGGGWPAQGRGGGPASAAKRRWSQPGSLGPTRSRERPRAAIASSSPRSVRALSRPMNPATGGGRLTPGGSGARSVPRYAAASVPKGMSSGSRPRLRHMAATTGLAAISRSAPAATWRSRRASRVAFSPNKVAPATKSSLAQ